MQWKARHCDGGTGLPTERWPTIFQKQNGLARVDAFKNDAASPAKICLGYSVFGSPTVFSITGSLLHNRMQIGTTGRTMLLVPNGMTRNQTSGTTTELVFVFFVVPTP
jgi:hypothetical protein